jgi:hypothetical protein
LLCYGGIMENTIVNENKSGKYFWWAHSAPIDVLTRKGTNFPPNFIRTLHMLRDSTASLYLADLINDKYNFGGVLYNLPPEVYKRPIPRYSQLSLLSNNDLILHSTRPALNDHETNQKRQLFKSGLELENIILQNMSKFFLHCDRKLIILSEEIANRFQLKDDSSYRAVIFDIYVDAYIAYKANADNLDDLKNPKNKVSNTDSAVGYIIYIPELVNESLNEIGTPSVLSVFSLDGAMTLVWSYLVLAKYANLIHEMISSNKPRIILAEFSPKISNAMIPNDLSFIVDSVDCEIKIDVTL